MFDLNSNNTKIWAKIGSSVTILVLVAACSSKQVINEASIQDQQAAELTDTAADQNPYVDQAELPAREQEQKQVSHKRSHAKKNHKRHVARKTVKPVEKREEVVKQEEAALPAIGSVENSGGQMPPPPPPPELALGESLDQTAIDGATTMDFSGLILENWYYILGLILLGAGGWYGFKAYSKRGTSKRKSKRRLVFN